MLRILFVIPYLEVEQSVKQVFQEVASLKEEEISYDIRLAEIGGHLDIENDAADIIIARGFTAASIKTSIPKIELQVSAFDMMKAAKKCIRTYHCEKIAFIGTTNMIFGADSFNEILDDVEVTSCQVKSSDMLDQAIDQLLKEGVDRVVRGLKIILVGSRGDSPGSLLPAEGIFPIFCCNPEKKASIRRWKKQLLPCAFPEAKKKRENICKQSWTTLLKESCLLIFLEIFSPLTALPQNG